MKKAVKIFTSLLLALFFSLKAFALMDVSAFQKQAQLVLEVSCLDCRNLDKLQTIERLNYLIPKTTKVLKLAYILPNTYAKSSLNSYVLKLAHMGYQVIMVEQAQEAPLLFFVVKKAKASGEAGDEGVSVEKVDKLWIVVKIGDFKLGIINLVERLANFPDKYNEFLSQMEGIDWLMVVLGDDVLPESAPLLFDTHKEIDLLCALNLKSVANSAMIRDKNRILMDLSTKMSKAVLLYLNPYQHGWKLVDVAQVRMR